MTISLETAECLSVHWQVCRCLRVHACVTSEGDHNILQNKIKEVKEKRAPCTEFQWRKHAGGWFLCGHSSIQVQFKLAVSMKQQAFDRLKLTFRDMTPLLH